MVYTDMCVCARFNEHVCVCVKERKIGQTDIIDEIDRNFKYDEKIPIVVLKTTKSHEEPGIVH